MLRLNISEVKAKLSHYIKLVRAGERITILDHKMPVAFLSPIEEKTSVVIKHGGGSLLNVISELKSRPTTYQTNSLDVLTQDRRK